ncbi:MAG: hypothetical protein KIT87_15500 [Anaerolineae bacterium]|nr:hypothetical protein [Anaerolineae bacterium]
MSSFPEFVNALDQVKDYRNNAAHTHPLSPRDYDKLEELLFQPNRYLSSGALKVLLLAWQQ